MLQVFWILAILMGVLVVSHCFNLHLPDDTMWIIFSHVYLPSIYLIDEMSVKVFGPSFNRFSLLSFKSSLYFLDNSPLLDISFANIFSQSFSLSLHCLSQSRNF